MKGNGPAAGPSTARQDRRAILFLTTAPSMEWLLIAILAALALLQGFAYWKAGLSYSPDSGFYLLYAARLHLALDYAAGAAMYAPLFPGVIALAMFVAPYPGQAAIVVLTISACVALLASYGAARLCRAPPLVALAFALLLFALPSTQHVFGYAWTEGLMLSLLVLTPACYAAWIQTNKGRYLWIMLLASTAAPLIKYVAIFVPLITTVLVAQNIVRRPAGETRWAPLGFCVLTFIPALAHAGYNYQRWGTVTGHGPSKVTLAANFIDLSTTIVNTLGTAGQILVIGCLAAGVWALARARQPLLAQLCSPLLATLAYGVGYFLCLAVAASTAQVDPVDQRLAAPGFGPTLVAAAQGAGLAYSVDALAGRTRLAIASVALIACSFVATQPVLLTHKLLRDKFVAPIEPVAAYTSGFGASVSRRELARLYAGELEGSGCVSVTMLNAQPPPGRVRREWFAIAEALAAPALTATETTLIEATRERIAVRTAAADSSARLIFVPSRMPELHRIRVPGRAERAEALRSRTAEAMIRIAEQARHNGCARHWVIVPRAAEWFRVELDQRFAEAKVTDMRVVGGYQAILVTFAE